MNPSGLGGAKVIGRLGQWPVISHFLRWCAHRYRENSVIRIRTGAAKGMLWRRHHRYVNGYWLGIYELEIQAALRRELSPGQTFFDVGANAGFFTLVAAGLVGDSGRCVAFDPLPENCASIREQIELNGLQNRCAIRQQAIADTEGTTSFFFGGPGSPVAHLGNMKQGEREIEVSVTTLDRACSEFGQPAFVKMDIEGAETTALIGAKHLLRHGRPKWLIELHGPECERHVKSALCEADYSFFDLAGDQVVADRTLPHHFVACPT